MAKKNQRQNSVYYYRIGVLDMDQIMAHCSTCGLCGLFRNRGDGRTYAHAHVHDNCLISARVQTPNNTGQMLARTLLGPIGVWLGLTSNEGIGQRGRKIENNWLHHHHHHTFCICTYVCMCCKKEKQNKMTIRSEWG